MSDDFGFDDVEFDDEFNDNEFSGGGSDIGGDRNPVSAVKGSLLEGAIGAATDNDMIKTKVKEALPNSISENWETADELLDVAERSKNNLINPIRKEMVSFKRNMNKVTPLVKRYLGNGIGSKFDELTQTRAESDTVDPNIQELTSVLGGIFNEENKAKIEADDRKMVLDMMDRQTKEERFKLQTVTLHDMLNNMRRMNEYNRSVNYSFQQKSLEYDIKRFHLLRQILDVNTRVGDASVEYLKSIVHNTSLPELVKQQQSELFQQMFVQKWYGDTLDSVLGQSRGMMRKFGRNIMTRASNTANNIVDSMRSVGEMADMVGGMTEGMDDLDEGNTDHKRELLKGGAKQLGSNAITQGFDSMLKSLVEANKDKDWFKNATALSDNVAANKNLFFKTFIDDMAGKDEGWKKILAPAFKILQEELPSTERQMASIGHLNSFKPTDPRQWDHASRTALIDIIPGWLERIHNLIAESMGRNEKLAYDDNSGGFIDKAKIKQGILDSIITDEERAEALAEVDTLIDSLTRDVTNVGDDERQLIREWLIREASTTADLDLRKLTTADSFSDLNNYDESKATAIAEAFDQLYNTDTLYRLNGEALGESEDNQHIAKLDKSFKKVVRKYSDDQEVFNTNITGGRRGLLRELGLLKADGEIDIQAILQHKLGGIDSSRDDTQGSLRDIIDQAMNPPAPPTPTPSYPIPPNSLGTPSQPPFTLPLSNGPPGSNTNNLQGTPGNIDLSSIDPNNPDQQQIINQIDRNAPTWNLPQGSGMDPLVTGVNFDISMSSAIDELIGIKTHAKDILDRLRDQTQAGDALGLGTSRTKTRMNDGDTEVKTYLSGILSTLATMHAANCDYYQNVKEFELGRHGLSAKVKQMLGGLMDKVTGTSGWIGKQLGNVWDAGSGAAKAIKEGFGSQFSFNAADVYVGDEESPRILARDFRTKKMFLFRDGKLEDKPIRDPEHITHELRAEDLSVIISQEEIDLGMVRINRKGVFKRIGGIIGKLGTLGFDAADGTINLSSKAFKGLKDVGGMAVDKIKKLFKGFKDTYIIGEDGKPILLATMQEFKLGRILVEIDGEFHVVKEMADLFKGNLYKRDENGNPVVIATIDDIKRGLCDVSGQLLDNVKGVGSKIADGAMKGFNGLKDMVKLPFTVMGNIWSSIKAKIEGRVLDKLVLNLPKDIIISANVVYLNDKGAGHDPRMKGGAERSSSATTEAMGATDAFREKTAHATDLVRKKYGEFKESGQVERAKAYVKRVAEDPKIITDLVIDEWNKYVEESGKEISRRDFLRKFLAEHPSPEMKERIKAIANKLPVSIKPKSINEAMDGVKDILPKNVKDIRNWMDPNSIKDKLTNSKLADKFKEGIKPVDTHTFLEQQNALTRYGKVDEAAARYMNLIKSPSVLREVIDEEWLRHIEEGGEPISKDAFEGQWLDSKFGSKKMLAKTALKMANGDIVPKGMGESLTKKADEFKEMAQGKISAKFKDIGDKLGIKDKAGDIKDTFLDKIHGSRDVDDEIKSPVRDLTELMKNRWRREDKEALGDDKANAKKARASKGDTDGDGFRQNSWQETLHLRRKAREEKETSTGGTSDKTKDGKKKSLLGLLLGALGTLIGGIGSLTAGIGNIGVNLVKFAGQFGITMAKGAWTVLKPALGGLLKLGGKAIGAVGGAVVRGTAAMASKAVNVAKPLAKQAGKYVAKRVAGVAAGAMLAATPIGWAVGATLAAWTVVEASVSIIAWFDRRKDIKYMEFLRHLEYGMVSGDNGYQHLNKISLRYFETNILKEVVRKDNSVQVGLTTSEVWDEFRGDFEDGGGDENFPEFQTWYEGRFLPVFYKWLSLCGTFNESYKSSQESGFFGGKDDLTLYDLDDRIPAEIKAGIAKQSLQYHELEHDPLEIIASPSTKVICSTYRANCEEFVDKIMGFLKVKVSKVETLKEEKKGDTSAVKRSSETDSNDSTRSNQTDAGEGYRYGTQRPGVNTGDTEDAKPLSNFGFMPVAHAADTPPGQEVIAKGGEGVSDSMSNIDESAKTKAEDKTKAKSNAEKITDKEGELSKTDTVEDIFGDPVKVMPETENPEWIGDVKSMTELMAYRTKTQTNIRNREDRQVKDAASKYGIPIKLMQRVIDEGSSGYDEYADEFGRYGIMSIPRAGQVGRYRSRHVNLELGAKKLQELLRTTGSEADTFAKYFDLESWGKDPVSGTAPPPPSEPAVWGMAKHSSATNKQYSTRSNQTDASDGYSYGTKRPTFRNASNDSDGGYEGSAAPNVVVMSGNHYSTRSTQKNAGAGYSYSTKRPSNYTLSKSNEGGYDLKKVKINKDVANMDYVEFIKSKEGFSPTAFWDHKQYSIGYGTKAKKDEENGLIPISEEEATKRLKSHADKDRDYIQERGNEIGLYWTTSELDALTSFTYNLGRGNFEKLIKGRNKEQIANAIPLYVKASGKTSPGLVKRRGEEKLIFNSGPKDKLPGEGTVLKGGDKATAEMVANEVHGNETPTPATVIPETTIAQRNDPERVNERIVSNAKQPSPILTTPTPTESVSYDNEALGQSYGVVGGDDDDLLAPNSPGTLIIKLDGTRWIVQESGELLLESAHLANLKAKRNAGKTASNVTVDTIKRKHSPASVVSTETKIEESNIIPLTNQPPASITPLGSDVVEEKIGEGNVIANESLSEQKTTNDLLRELANSLTKTMGAPETKVAPNSSTPSPIAPPQQTVTTAPARVSASSRYK